MQVELISSGSVFQTVVQALAQPHPCACDCFHTLTLDERLAAITAMLRFDDAIRGFGYQPVYELAADRLYRAAQQQNDPASRLIPVRDSACIHRRLVGFAVHEIIHALEGDCSKANYGIPWGAPYGVPVDVPLGEEQAFLEPFNVAEARAFVGVTPVAEALFEISFAVYTARDIGTYGLPGGNAVVDVPAGFRAVPHWDSVLHRARYYELGRKLEARATAYFTSDVIGGVVRSFEEAEARGRALRRVSFPDVRDLARIPPRLPGRNDLCICGSTKKFKKCCGRAA